jgi:hypothetical protein
VTWAWTRRELLTVLSQRRDLLPILLLRFSEIQNIFNTTLVRYDGAFSVFLSSAAEESLDFRSFPRDLFPFKVVDIFVLGTNPTAVSVACFAIQRF